MMNKTYQNDICRSIHETVSDMFEAGAIDQKTMLLFDESCLHPIHTFTASEIRTLRESDVEHQSASSILDVIDSR